MNWFSMCSHWEQVFSMRYEKVKIFTSPYCSVFFILFLLCLSQDEFRMESGDRLLEMLENTFSRKMNIPQGSWLIFLSKPTQQDHQLLMALASEQGNTHTLIQGLCG